LECLEAERALVGARRWKYSKPPSRVFACLDVMFAPVCLSSAAQPIADYFVGMPEMTTMRGRVVTATVARLATTGADGRPHLVPIVFVLDGERLYSAVDAKPKRSRRLQRLGNARERPDVTVPVDHYEEPWDRLWWVRRRGRARVPETGVEAECALPLLSDKYEQYRSERPGLPVLAVDILEWSGWEASAS
jgi:PPOX class probable F420-dependent enzyme